MKRYWNEFMSGFLANQQMRSQEVCDLLPNKLINEPVDYGSDYFDEAEHYRDLYNEAGYLVANDQFNEMAELAEKVHQGGGMVSPTVYAHEWMVAPAEEVIEKSQQSVTFAGRVARRFGEWYEKSPNNPYAAGLYAKALHNVGYAYRGTDWGHKVGWRDAFKLEEFCAHARNIFQISAPTCSDHWYWRTSYFDFAISDYKNDADLHLRFEKARETQPLSLSLWTGYAHKLLPRWYGDFDKLDRLFLSAHQETREHVGDEILFYMIDMVRAYEEGTHEMRLNIAMMSDIADRYAKSDDLRQQTIAVSFYAWAMEYEKFLSTLSNMGTINMHYWYQDGQRLEWAIAYALQQLKRGYGKMDKAA